MMITIFEISRPFQWKPGKHAGPFDSKTFYRFWWLWFSISFLNMSHYDYYKHVAAGNTRWEK